MTASQSGLANFWYVLCRRKRRRSLIQNSMILDMYEQKIKYILDTKNQKAVNGPVKVIQRDPDSLMTPQPEQRHTFESLYLSYIVSCAFSCTILFRNRVDREQRLNLSSDSLDMEIQEINKQGNVVSMMAQQSLARSSE